MNFSMESFKRSPNPDSSGSIKKENTLEQDKISIKRATIEDLEDYKHIRLEAVNKDPDAFNMSPERAFRENRLPDSEWKNDLLDDKQIIFLSKYDSKTIGIIKGVERQKEKAWLLRSFYIDQNFRKNVTGISISEEMLKIILDEIKSRGGVEVRLGVERSREKIISLYEKFGFKEISHIKALILAKGNSKYLKRWQVMELNLSTKSE